MFLPLANIRFVVRSSASQAFFSSTLATECAHRAAGSKVSAPDSDQLEKLLLFVGRSRSF